MAKSQANLQIVENEQVQESDNQEMTQLVEENAPGTPTEALKGDRVVIGVSVSSAFGERVNKFSNSVNKSVAQVVREALAKFVGYDLSQEPIPARGARTKYANKEEAAAAQKAKVAERNELIKRLLEDYRKKESQNGTVSEA